MTFGGDLRACWRAPLRCYCCCCCCCCCWRASLQRVQHCPPAQ
ncbi:MAG: hypothetical protein ACK4ZJ_16415 [Allorhizobium sp.]